MVAAESLRAAARPPPPEPGEFIMEVSFYGDPAGWQITVDQPAR